MCLGNTTTYRCCGRKKIEYTGAGHCDLEQPDPKTHIVHGWKFIAEICTECTARERAEAANNAHHEFEMARRAKGVLEYFAGFRSHPRIRDESDWFIPREEPQVESLSSTPLSFSRFVETIRGTVGIGAFFGKEERILWQDVGDYIEYLENGDVNFPTQNVHQFRLLFYSIRVSEQENFDFDPKVISIPTFREYLQVFGEQSVVGDEAREASWRQTTKAYESFLANFEAQERMMIDWQVSRDKLAINDRRELYGFNRQDYLDLGGDVGWVEIQYKPTISSFHEFVQKNTEIWTFENYDGEEDVDTLLTFDLERYESDHLYPYGTIEQINQWHNLRKSVAQHPLEFTPGPDTPDLLSFANLHRREMLARPNAQLTIRSLVPRYSYYIRSTSQEVQANFLVAWETHIERTRELLYGWEGEGFHPLVTDLRDMRKVVFNLIFKAMKRWPPWEEAGEVELIYSKLNTAGAILQQHIALRLPLTVEELAEIQTRINQCTELIDEAPLRSQLDDDASLVDEDEDEDEEQVEAEEENIPEVSRYPISYEVPVSPCSEYNPPIDRLNPLALPVSARMDDETQEEIFARFLDEDEDSDDEDRPWKRTRYNPPEHWFGEGGPFRSIR